MAWIVIIQYTLKNGKSHSGSLALPSRGKHSVRSRKMALETVIPEITEGPYKKVEAIAMPLEEAEALVKNLQAKIKLAK